MPDSEVSSGLQPPATPIEASPHAATVRAAYLTGSREIFMLPVLPRTVRDQLKLESCVSCASAAAMEARHKGVPELSAMSHYRVARVEKKFGGSKGRLTVFEGMSTLEHPGICSHRLHVAAMTDEGFAKPLSGAAKADALKHRLMRQGLSSPGYDTVTGASRVVAIRRALKQKRPVLLGFNLPRTYPDGFLAADHQWDDPSVDLSSDGHCVVVIGFDDLRNAFKIQDSRGEQMFKKGCWWMGYAVADSKAIVDAISLSVLP